MAMHSSATAHSETPHVRQQSRTNTIMNALIRRAQAALNDESLDAQSRAIIRYGMETNDPWLAELVRRADAGESLIRSVQELGACESQTFELNEHHSTNEHHWTNHHSTNEYHWINEHHSTNEQTGAKIDEELLRKVEDLAAIICGTGGESAAALFVLMGTLENSTHPKALANTAKHFAFARCSQFNLYGMVDAQMALVEGKLLTVGTPMSG